MSLLLIMAVCFAGGVAAGYAWRSHISYRRRHHL
jgi:hypothetical protein